MGISNFKVGLLRKYARWSGERLQVEKEITDIEEGFKTLDEKRARVAQLEQLQQATQVLMSELDPKWKPDDTKPSVPQKQQLPWEHGASTRTAFAIMRELAEPISTLELSKLTIEKLGGSTDDEDLLDRMRSNLDNSLRNAKDFVRNTGGRPSRWAIMDPNEADTAASKSSG